MTIGRIILLSAIPGLMFCILPVQGMEFRFSWQLVSIWAAGVAFAGMLSSWWWKGFFLLALVQVMMHGPILTSYMVLTMIAIFLAAAAGFSRMDSGLILDSMCVAAILLSLWIIGQKAGLFPYSDIGTIGAGPFNRDSAGTFIALCLPAFFGREPRFYLWGNAIFRVYAIPLLALAIVFCSVTPGIFAAIAGVAAYMAVSGFLRRGAMIAIAGSCLIIVIFANLLDVRDAIPIFFENGRWPVWRHTILAIWAQPFGHGLGSFAQIFPWIMQGKVEPDMLHAHNEYLQVGFEMGVQGMLLVAIYPLWVGLSAWRKRRRLTEYGRISAAGITALAVSCMGWHTFHIAPLAVLGAAWLGMARKEVE